MKIGELASRASAIVITKELAWSSLHVERVTSCTSLAKRSTECFSLFRDVSFTL